MFCRKPTKPIVIFKGDDTNFDNNRKLFFEIESLDALNPTKIEFSFLGVKRVFDTIPTDGRFEVSFSHEDTAKFPLGTSFATLTAIDSDDRERTLDNRIAILVTNNVALAYCSDDDKLISIKIGTIDSNIVPPNAEAQTGEAADAKATYEALEDKATKPELQAEVERAKAAENGLDERITELENDEGGITELMFETTHADLVTLRDNGALIPGMQYRITDYVATTVQEHTQSANHPFDIIVTADSANKLNEVARAIRHNGDTYFPATTKFEAWQIWYSLDNDTNRFEWADEENGKGVIYRMIDEFNNDVPYDFKGIKMQAYRSDGSYNKSYRYTFGDGVDDTLTGKSCSNKMKPRNGTPFLGFKSYINGNTFYSGCCNNIFDSDCYDNTFSSYCHNNTFGMGCHGNIFGTSCHGNIFGMGCSDNIIDSDCYDNIFGEHCYGNTIGMESYDNIFDMGCSDNTFGEYCTHNIFGIGCSANTFGTHCHCNVFGSMCYYNTLSSFCEVNTFGGNCDRNELSDFFHFTTLQKGIVRVTIDCTKDRGEYEYCKNIEIKSGVIGKGINIDDVEQSYHTEIRPENSITISI